MISRAVIKTALFFLIKQRCFLSFFCKNIVKKLEKIREVNGNFYELIDAPLEAIGVIGLIIVSVLPIFFNGVFKASVSFGGTSLIIIVSVVLETVKQVESQMLVRNYKGFLND